MTVRSSRVPDGDQNVTAGRGEVRGDRHDVTLGAHVDQEWGYAVTVPAPSFAAFVRGLRSDEDFEED